MKILFRSLLPFCFALAILGSSKSARALGPIGLEVGAQVGVGTNPVSSSPVNPLGIGIGARAGVVLFGGLYGGVKIMDYLGGSTSVLGVSSSVHGLQEGVDVGYGFKILILTIRPQVGIGNMTFTTSTDGLGSASSSGLYIEPGVTALIGLGLLYVGADANYLYLSNTGTNADGSSSSAGAFTVHGQVGLQF